MNEGGTLKAKVGRYDTMLENINLRKTELKKRLLEYTSEEEKKDGGSKAPLESKS